MRGLAPVHRDRVVAAAAAAAAARVEVEVEEVADPVEHPPLLGEDDRLIARWQTIMARPQEWGLLQPLRGEPPRAPR